MISTCILTKNAMEYVGRAIQCAAGFSEILVLDNGSTDGTVDYVRQFTDKIIIDNSPDLDFAYARNRLAHAAKNDIIFMLDSDEFVNPAIFETITKSYKAIQGQVGVMPLAESYGLGMADPWHFENFPQSGKVRFYDRRYCFWSGRIHEALVGRGMLHQYILKNYLWHRCFQYSDESRMRKIQFYNKTMNRTESKYQDPTYWAEEYKKVYAAQKPVPSVEEAKFVTDFYAQNPWKLTEVNGG